MRRARFIAAPMVLLASAIGCSTDSGAGGYRTVQRMPADASTAAVLESCEFERGPAIVPVWRWSILDRLGLLPKYIEEQLSASDRTRLQCDAHDLRLLRSRWARLDGRRYFFLAGEKLMSVEDREGQAPTVVLERVADYWAGAALTFDVARFDDALWIIFAGRDGLYQMRGRHDQNGLTFALPQRICTLDQPVDFLQAVGSDRSLHVIFTTGEGMRYLRSHHPESDWNPARTISPTGGIGVLIVEEPAVFILWTDHRFTDGNWWGVGVYHKLFIRRSDNGGRTFRQPVLLSRRREESDDSQRPLMYPAKEGLILLFPNGGSTVALQHSQWRLAVIDRQLQRLVFRGTVSGKSLLDAYAKRMMHVMQLAPDGDGPDSR